jgi:hypothetical protein
MKMYKLSEPYNISDLEVKEIKRVCEEDHCVYWDEFCHIEMAVVEKRQLKTALKHIYFDNLEDVHNFIEKQSELL